MVQKVWVRTIVSQTWLFFIALGRFIDSQFIANQPNLITASLRRRKPPDRPPLPNPSKFMLINLLLLKHQMAGFFISN